MNPAFDHAHPDALCVCGHRRAEHYMHRGLAECIAMTPSPDNKQWAFCFCCDFVPMDDTPPQDTLGGPLLDDRNTDIKQSPATDNDDETNRQSGHDG